MTLVNICTIIDAVPVCWDIIIRYTSFWQKKQNFGGRKMKKILYIIAVVLVLALLAACNGDGEPTGSSTATTTQNAPSGTTATSATSGTTAPTQPGNPDQPQDIAITGVTFENKTVTYNGEEHVLSIAGTVPEGVTVA